MDGLRVILWFKFENLTDSPAGLFNQPEFILNSEWKREPSFIHCAAYSKDVLSQLMPLEPCQITMREVKIVCNLPTIAQNLPSVSLTSYAHSDFLALANPHSKIRLLWGNWRCTHPFLLVYSFFSFHFAFIKEETLHMKTEILCWHCITHLHLFTEVITYAICL